MIPIDKNIGNYIKCGITNAQNIPTTTYTKIALDKIIDNTSNNLTLNNGEIIIGKDISKVLVIGQQYGNYRDALIYLNKNGVTFSQYGYTLSSVFIAGVTKVTEGDKISFYAYSNTTNTQLNPTDYVTFLQVIIL